MGRKSSIGSPQNVSAKIKKGWIGSPQNKALKIKKGWIGDENGIARLFFSGSAKWAALLTQNFGTSDDASTWTIAESVFTKAPVRMTVGDEYYFAATTYNTGMNTLWRSVDGVTWEKIQNTVYNGRLHYFGGRLIIARRTSRADFSYSNDNGATITSVVLLGSTTSGSLIAETYGKIEGCDTTNYYFLAQSSVSTVNDGENHYPAILYVYSDGMAKLKQCQLKECDYFTYKNACMFILDKKLYAMRYAVPVGSSNYATIIERYDYATNSFTVVNILNDDAFEPISAVVLRNGRVLINDSTGKLHIFNGSTITHTNKTFGKGIMAHYDGRTLVSVSQGLAYTDDGGETMTTISISSATDGKDVAVYAD